MALTAVAAQKAIRLEGNPKIVEAVQRFFKTGPGEYGEGDRFIGVGVPVTRRIAREFRGMPLAEIVKLLKSPIHEDRLLALIMLTEQYLRGDEPARKNIYDTYLKNRSRINNWDLVDVSAPLIVGAHLEKRDRAVLFKLAKSSVLWDRRISIVSTLGLIRREDLRDTFRISEVLLRDKEDLIHKAVGWMLREAGKKDLAPLEAFLRTHCRVMPRTMLRYALEKLPEAKRRMYMKGAV